MTSSYEHSARDYEQAANETRRRLTTTLDDLSRNLTPGRVLDEMMTYARGGGGNFMRGLGNAASANPIPTLLIGIGAAMFLTGRGRLDGNGEPLFSRPYRPEAAHEPGAMSRMGETATDAGRSATRTMKQGTSAVRSAAVDTAGRAGDSLSSAASSVGDATATAAEQVASAADKLRSAAASGTGMARDTVAAGASAAAEGISGMSDRAAEMAGSVTEAGREFGHRSRERAQQLGERLSTFAREQPLVAAAAGLAIGAAIAAILPRTQTEDSLLGETSDAFKEGLGDAAGEQYERARSSAGHVAERVKASAEREGLTPEAAADAARDLSEKVKNVAAASEEAVAEELRK